MNKNIVTLSFMNLIYLVV